MKLILKKLPMFLALVFALSLFASCGDEALNESLSSTEAEQSEFSSNDEGDESFENSESTENSEGIDSSVEDDQSDDYGLDYDFEEYDGPADVHASGNVNNVNWDLTDGVLTIGGDGEIPNYDYPENDAPWRYYKSVINKVIIQNGVTAVGEGAFCYMPIKELVIEEGVKEIRDYAFSGCTNLEKARLSDSICKMGICAFSENIFLKEINLPKNITEIEYSAFENCWSLNEVVIPEGVKKIGERAFAQCSYLRKITFPSTLTEIESDAFFICIRLGEIVGNDNFIYENNALYNKDKTCLIFVYPFADGESFTVPEGVVKIADSAFSGNINFKEVILPETLKEIGAYSFYKCAFEKINLPVDVVKIGDSALKYCAELETITYRGTKADFEKIDVAEEWVISEKEVTLTCTDGEIIFEAGVIDLP